MKDRWTRRRELQGLLLGATGCGIQHTGWSCNSCFHALDIGVDADRLHEMWEATLVLRGDYKNGEYGIDMPDQRLDATVAALTTALKRRIQ